MARFKDYDRSQGLFLTVNLEEQLLPGMFEKALAKDAEPHNTTISLHPVQTGNHLPFVFKVFKFLTGNNPWGICRVCAYKADSLA